MRPRAPAWSGRTVVCIASGPSLTAEDCAAVRASGLPTIVTNTTFRLAPWADALFGFDYQWWRVYWDEVRATFRGRLFCQSSKWPRRGLEWPGGFRGYRSFGNSGACAIALAVACGSSRVVMLGYDCQPKDGRMHHHDDHPAPLRNCDTMKAFLPQFARLAKWTANVEVLNASRETALTEFARVDLRTALGERQREAA
jgi:hypothetical protein